MTGRDGMMTAEPIDDAPAAFKKALIERALSMELGHQLTKNGQSLAALSLAHCIKAFLPHIAPNSFIE